MASDRPVIWELGKEVRLFNGSLKRLRKEFGLYQRDVAKRVGIGEGTYSQIETMRCVPSVEVAEKIAGVFGKSVEELFPMEFLKFMKNQAKSEISYGKMEIKALEEYVAKETLRLEESCDPEERMLKTELEELIKNKMNILSPREQKIIKMLYGLDGESPHTLVEVGDFFGVTRERVRQILEKGLKKLRKDKDLKKYGDAYYNNEERMIDANNR